jgi:C-terminal processing protease CtpA/Prc
MKKYLCTALLLLTSLYSFCQENKISSSDLNLNFEESDQNIPIGWKLFGNENYEVNKDSITKYNGKYSASIELKNGSQGYKVLSYSLPANYPGNTITLKGFVKTENVVNGYSSLWIRIDPALGYHEVKIDGTTDWTEYEVSLTMNPEKTKQIVVGGALFGSGKLWLDNFQIYIDGKPISSISPMEKKEYLAEKDREFDHGSGLDLTDLSEKQAKRLHNLALVWGFLKYYHPHIASGKYNWDYELFRIVPKILEENTNADDVLNDWINSLGDMPDAPEKVIDSKLTKLQPDLGWINNSGFSDELQKSLLKVKYAKRENHHYYIGLNTDLFNPEFKNESPYLSMPYPDAGFRLLSLFRYWNIIQYYFPYKNLIGQDWKLVLKEFIPQFISSKNEKDYTLSVLELIGKISDSHANIWGENKAVSMYHGENSIPYEVKFIDEKLVVTAGNDLKSTISNELIRGDIITKINGKNIEEIVNEKSKYFPASNQGARLRDMAQHILRTNDPNINVSYRRGNKTYSKTLQITSLKELQSDLKTIKPDTSFAFIDKDIAYVDHSLLKRAHLPTLWPKIKQTKGLIIDLRNYPSDFPGFDFCNYLLPKSIDFVQNAYGSIENPGTFTLQEPLSTGQDNPDYYKGKVVLLINEVTQSASEFHAMRYRVHPNAVLIGSPTAGADGDISMFYLPGGLYTGISGVGVYYPDGRETQRVGILPDVYINPTITALTENRDELMEKAVEIIKNK